MDYRKTFFVVVAVALVVYGVAFAIAGSGITVERSSDPDGLNGDSCGNGVWDPGLGEQCDPSVPSFDGVENGVCWTEGCTNECRCESDEDINFELYQCGNGVLETDNDEECEFHSDCPGLDVCLKDCKCAPWPPGMPVPPAPGGGK